MFEELMRAGWPAIEEIPVDGWLARFSGGVTQRANSVLPLAASADMTAALEQVEKLYADRGLPVVFQVGEQDTELDRVLDARGYASGSPTVVQTAVVDIVLAALGTHQVDVAEAADAAWLGLWWAVDGRGDAAALAVAEKILGGGPALYGTIRDARGAAAVGRLALVGEWGGLYCLAVRPDMRRRGLGAAVLAGLLTSGRERGITRSWLQVRAENAGARRLYQRAGYTDAAHYHYRSHRRQEPVQGVHAEA
ncbi:GNAT family N-acetyltransferase [Actinophytocola sp.]|uniref:GNAT family N-acetyltransferase n=1 Tax=Actinophytocola sp. TaxID=1872138 RepID=UPI0038998F59